MAVPDPIQQGLAKAQSWEDRLTENFYECSCGAVVPWGTIETLTPDPYAEPYCQDCVGNHKKSIASMLMDDTTRAIVLPEIQDDHNLF